MTLGSHQSAAPVSHDHLTPPWILESLGTFDLDPCASDPRPWDTAKRHFTMRDNGLLQRWDGRIWCNPPFALRLVAGFIHRMVLHDHGTLLVHARTDTKWFSPIFENAAGLLFLQGRVVFHKPDGTLQTSRKGKVMNSGAPVVLCAFGVRDMEQLAGCGLEGHFVPLRLPRSVLAMAILPTWREVLIAWLSDQRGPVALSDIYRAFLGHPKTAGNSHWRAKLRQVVQMEPTIVRTGRGQYAYRGAAS